MAVVAATPPTPTLRTLLNACTHSTVREACVSFELIESASTHTYRVRERGRVLKATAHDHE